MFGTVFRMVPKPGQKQAVIDLMTRADDRDIRNVRGFVMSHVFDAGTDLWGVAIFEDEKTYRDNANDPEQDRWYRQLREMLESDPEWHDGTVMTLQR